MAYRISGPVQLSDFELVPSQADRLLPAAAPLGIPDQDLAARRTAREEARTRRNGAADVEGAVLDSRRGEGGEGSGVGQVERVERDDTVGEGKESGGVREKVMGFRSFRSSSYIGVPHTYLASVDSAYSLRPSGASLRLEIPCGRAVSVFITASSLVSYVAGLTRRLCDRRRSQILTTLQI